VAAMQIAKECMCVFVRAHTFASGLYANPKRRLAERKGRGEKGEDCGWWWAVGVGKPCTLQHTHTHSRKSKKAAAGECKRPREGLYFYYL